MNTLHERVIRVMDGNGTSADRRCLQRHHLSIKRKQEKCKHTRWKGMRVHGRCCPSCGFFVVDFGD